jgi:surface antigen
MGDFMRVNGTTLAFCVLLGSAATVADANAARDHQDSSTATRSTRDATATRKSAHHHHATTFRGRRHASPQRRGRTYAANAYAAHGAATNTGAGISCVPYARSVTGMAVSGNGGDWWNNAAGTYDRGQQPEPGSVMAFRATGGMTRGHVAVVSRVLGAREVLIDHANWGGPGIRRGSIMHNVSVVDVSDRNDWTAVRVQSGYDGNSFGRVYPIYGFIHNRPDAETGTAYAAAPLRRSQRIEQVAEMPAGMRSVSFQQQGTEPLRNAAPYRHR